MNQDKVILLYNTSHHLPRPHNPPIPQQSRTRDRQKVIPHLHTKQRSKCPAPRTTIAFTFRVIAPIVCIISFVSIVVARLLDERALWLLAAPGVETVSAEWDAGADAPRASVY